MRELPSQLRLLREFYYTAALKRPAESGLAHAHAHVMSNSVVFFSQRSSEAYRGHFDTDDALVIHPGG